MQFKVRDKRNKGWFYLDNDYLNGYAKVFGAIGTAIYVSLCRHADSEQKCFPSQKLIAEELNIGERTVRNYLKMFEEYHLIYKESQSRGKQGEWRKNVYWLLDKSEWIPKATGADGKRIHSREANDDTHGRQQVPTKDTKIKNTHIKEATQSVAGVEINKLIELFKGVNPSYERLFGNKTQRSALERLVKKYGEEKLSGMILFCEKIRGVEFAPTITTPYELEKNLGKLVAYYEKERSKKKTVEFII